MLTRENLGTVAVLGGFAAQILILTRSMITYPLFNSTAAYLTLVTNDKSAGIAFALSIILFAMGTFLLADKMH